MLFMKLLNLDIKQRIYTHNVTKPGGFKSGGTFGPILWPDYLITN
jgi:hypothetical protein